jgi:hypothetical protein
MKIMTNGTSFVVQAGISVSLFTILEKLNYIFFRTFSAEKLSIYSIKIE